jgi:competence protein ComEC
MYDRGHGERGSRRLAQQWRYAASGQPNPYGHPDPNALAELDGVGALIWRTDQHGTITIAFTDHGPVVTPER